MTEDKVNVIRRPRTILWIARILSLLYILFVIFALPCLVYPECRDSPPPSNWPTGLGLIIFPFGVCAAFVVGWFWQLTGGTLAIGCIIIAMLIPSIPLTIGLSSLFLLLVSLLHIAYGWGNLRTKMTNKNK